MKTIKLLFVALVGGIVTGCGPSPTEGLVSVIDLDTNAPVANATVTLTVDDPNNPGAGFYLCNESNLVPSHGGTTNAGGVTEKFCFKLPAVLKVSVKAGTKTGTTTLSLEEGETVTATCKVSN